MIWKRTVEATVGFNTYDGLALRLLRYMAIKTLPKEFNPNLGGMGGGKRADSRCVRELRDPWISLTPLPTHLHRGKHVE